MGDEPIRARVAADPGTVAAPHGHGAPRFDASGAAVAKVDPRIDGDWRVAGWVTSGGYAHHVGLSMAQGYLPAALGASAGPGRFEVEILGRPLSGLARAGAALRPDGRAHAGLSRSGRRAASSRRDADRLDARMTPLPRRWAGWACHNRAL